ncbi:MAG: zinc-binding dehydrogenase [Microbacteriaceae bacterium]
MLPSTTSRAAVLTEFGAPLTMQELPLPDALEPGAVLVQIVCSTLCGTDVEIWEGRMGWPGMLPMVLGHEMVGEVVATGEGARDAIGRPVEIGQRIGWSESVCGACHGCTVIREPVFCSKRGYGFLQRSDTFPFSTAGLCEYAYVTPGAQKLILPDGVKDTWASMAGCASKTVLRAFDRVGGVTAGQTVVVQGSGALGIFAAAVAKISGAGTVIVVGAPDSRLELAKRFGADHVVNISAGSAGIIQRVQDLTDGGADLVMDFAGARSVGPEAIGMAGLRSRFVVVGSTGDVGDPIPLSAIMGKEMTVVGSINGDVADYLAAIRFFETFADRFPWDALFSAPVGLDAASEKIEHMHHLDEVKAVFDPRIR